MRRGAWHGGYQHQRRDRVWMGSTATPRSRFGRPPPSPSAGMSHHSVPLWEKNFCTEVCRIPWHRICDVRNFMGWYDDIVKWNDSAGEEAFRNAKARYWAEINGLHCNLPLPDPDMYIDIVGDDVYIDPQLVEDLEDLHKQPAGATSPGGFPSVPDIPVLAPTGWFELKEPGRRIPSVVGDSDDPAPMNDTNPDNNTNSGNATNLIGWTDIKDMVPNGRGDNTEAKPVNGDNNGDATNSISQDKCWRNQEDKINEPERRYGRKQNGNCFGSRYAPQRFQGEDLRTHNNSRKCRGKKRTQYGYDSVR